jgi:hypothetical protein
MTAGTSSGMRRLVVIALVVSACATAPRATGAGASYRCADGSEIAVSFERDLVRVRLPDGTWTLPRLAGGGERYGNRELLVTVSGGTVRVERGGTVLHADCTR